MFSPFLRWKHYQINAFPLASVSPCSMAKHIYSSSSWIKGVLSFGFLNSSRPWVEKCLLLSTLPLLPLLAFASLFFLMFGIELLIVCWALLCWALSIYCLIIEPSWWYYEIVGAPLKMLWENGDCASLSTQPCRGGAYLGFHSRFVLRQCGLNRTVTLLYPQCLKSRGVQERVCICKNIAWGNFSNKVIRLFWTRLVRHVLELYTLAI